MSRHVVELVFRPTAHYIPNRRKTKILAIHERTRDSYFQQYI